MDEKSQPAIAILGAGAVGSVLGGLLAQAGENVTLVARRPHAEAINTNGLRIDGARGEFTVAVRAVQDLNFRPDLVLLAVKTQDVDAACEQIRPHAAGVPVVTLQNGVRSDEMAAARLGSENIISGVVLFNARFLDPGHVTYGIEGGLLVGEAFRENGQRVADIAVRLNQAVKTEICGNIHGARWTKLLTNALGNGLEAMTGLSLRECMAYSALRRIGVHILKEALAVTEKAGIRLESLPGLPITVFRLTVKAPLVVAATVLRLTLSSTDTVTSTLQSIRRGRPTEIDYLNGEIVALGRQVGLATPYNAKVVELVREVERTQRFHSPQRLEDYFSSC